MTQATQLATPAVEKDIYPKRNQGHFSGEDRQMPWLRCETCGEGFYQHTGRPARWCPEHRAGGGKYGGDHKKLRAATISQAYGRPCSRCGQPMLYGQELQLDHLDGAGPADYLPGSGFSHAHCNMSAGAAKGNRMRAPGGWASGTPRPTVIPPSCEPGSIRHLASCTCGGNVVYEPGEWWTSRCW